MNADKLKNKSQHKKTSILERMLQCIAFGLVILGLWIVICVFYREPLRHPFPTTRPAIASKQAPARPIPTAPPANEQNDPVKEYWTIYGTKGDFTAGVGGTMFALAGFIYLYLSFKKQHESNAIQIESFKHDKIESRFFELIRLHRDNVAELSFTYYFRQPITNGRSLQKEPEKETVTHRKIFQAVKQQFASVAEELAFFFEEASPDEIYEDAYKEELTNNATIYERKINLHALAKADILYLIVFFGVGKDGSETILSITGNKYKCDFIKKVINYAALKPKVQSEYWLQWATIKVLDNKHTTFQAILTKREDLTPQTIGLSSLESERQTIEMYYPDNYEKYYGGHQFRLGHYFRHLYQTVSFINEQEDLSGAEQRSYIRHLRGQLSTDEQIVFFLNSLSQLGRIWELEDKQSGIAVERKFQMVSDYGLIKNIPNNQVIAGLKLTNFYPDINYEGFSSVIT